VRLGPGFVYRNYMPTVLKNFPWWPKHLDKGD